MHNFVPELLNPVPEIKVRIFFWQYFGRLNLKYPLCVATVL